MKTLTLQEAAAFLKIHPVTLLGKVNAGVVPGAKIGKRWVFVDVDLVEYLRSNYRRQVSSDSTERKEAEWLSIDKRTRLSGGSTLPLVDDEYAKALGLQTESKHRSTTTV